MYLYMCMYMYMYVCMYVCIYIYIYIYRSIPVLQLVDGVPALRAAVPRGAQVRLRASTVSVVMIDIVNRIINSTITFIV